MIRPGLPPTPASRGCSPRPPGRSPPAEPRPCHRAAHQALHVAIRGEHARNLSGFPTAPYRAHPSRATNPPPASTRYRKPSPQPAGGRCCTGSTTTTASEQSDRNDRPRRLTRSDLTFRDCRGGAAPGVEGDRKLQGLQGVPRPLAHYYNTAKVRTSRRCPFLVNLRDASGRS